MFNRDFTCFHWGLNVVVVDLLWINNLWKDEWRMRVMHNTLPLCPIEKEKNSPELFLILYGLSGDVNSFIFIPPVILKPHHSILSIFMKCCRAIAFCERYMFQKLCFLVAQHYFIESSHFHLIAFHAKYIFNKLNRDTLSRLQWRWNKHSISPWAA